MLLGQGEFSISPGAAGTPPGAEARYDPEMHEFIESFEILADSTWVYKVGFRQTKSGFAAFLEALFGGDKDASVHVDLPRDVPFELDFKGEAGGVEMELGGLWITDADIRFEKGGIMLSVDEPMPHPVDRFLIQTRMGGVQAEGLGNASPRLLGINCGMGGANVDLDGQWRNDCDAHLVVTMGGMAVARTGRDRLHPDHGRDTDAAPGQPGDGHAATPFRGLGEDGRDRYHPLTRGRTRHRRYHGAHRAQRVPPVFRRINRPGPRGPASAGRPRPVRPPGPRRA